MDVKKIAETPSMLKIMITGIDVSLLNSLRRTIMNAVPTYAAESIVFYENSSIISDEMLSHRIGMLPIRVFEKKTKKGDAIKLTLDKEGPGLVYSSDIIVHGKEAEIPDKMVPLVKLKKDQRIKLEIEAIAGTGKEHVKWQPALVTYKQIPKITFEHVKDTHAIVKNCPPKSLEVKAGKIFVADPLNFQLYGLLQDKFPNEVSVDYDTDSFVLTVETFQGKTNKEVLLEGVESIQEKNQAFKEAVKQL